MKKFNRAVSLVLLIAFVLMMQLPALAAEASTNLIPSTIDPSFDTMFKNSGSATTDIGTIGIRTGSYATPTYDAENGWVSFALTKNDWTNLTIRNIQFKPGKFYVVSYDAKLGEGVTGTHYANITVNGDYKNDNGNKYAIHATVKPQLTSTEWKRGAILIRFSEETTGAHISIRPGNGNDYPSTVMIDNLGIYEINNDDPENLLWDSAKSFEAGAPTSNFTIPDGASTSTFADATDGGVSLKISGATPSNGTVTNICRFVNVPSITGGCVYEMTADVKLAAPAEGVKAYITTQYAGGAAAPPAATGENVSDASVNHRAVNDTEWTTIRRLYASNIYATASVHFGITLTGMPESGVDVLVDNVCLKKVAEPKAVEGVGDTTGSVAEFENKIAVNVVPATAKDVWVIIANYNGKNLADTVIKPISVSEKGQTVSHTFTKENQNAVVYVWEAETMAPLLKKSVFGIENLLADLNYSFEAEDLGLVTNKSGFNKVDEACELTRTEGTEALPAQDGNYFLSVTNRSAANAGLRITFAPVPEIGKTYIASAWVRLADETEDKVGASVSLIVPGGATVKVSNVENKKTELTAGEWKKVYRVFTLVPAEDATEPYVNKGLHFGISTDEGETKHNLYVDNFSIKEYLPEFTD